MDGCQMQGEKERGEGNKGEPENERRGKDGHNCRGGSRDEEGRGKICGADESRSSSAEAPFPFPFVLEPCQATCRSRCSLRPSFLLLRPPAAASLSPEGEKGEGEDAT